MQPVRNITQTKCNLFEMLSRRNVTIQNVTHTKGNLYEMLPRRNLTYMKCYPEEM